MTLEQLVRAVSATTSLWSPAFTMQDLASGLHDALTRIEKLEAEVKALQPQPKPAGP